VNTYRRAPGVLSEVIDGSTMLIDETSAELLTLNGVGATVWQSLTEQGATLDQSVDAVIVEFPDAPEEAVSADVLSFLEQLAGAGLVVVAS
jgi:hypothetical protein